MFGYITVNQNELKVKDLKKYNAYYCGLCKALKKNHGFVGQLTLTYDMTFLVILLTSLYELKPKSSIKRCIVHPMKKHMIFENEFSKYCSDINILLSYYKLKDNWNDERNWSCFLASKFIENDFKRLEKKYDRQSKAIKTYIENLNKAEKNNEKDIDIVAGYTGNAIGEIFVYKEDEWSNILRKMGFFMGKFIYIMDAFEDVDKDIDKGNYNPLKELFKLKEFDDQCKVILTMMIAECAREFEKLPIIINVDILRNILYTGVWIKYEAVTKKRNKNLKK